MDVIARESICLRKDKGMKRKFKKALSIAVAASLALSMPVSVMAECC